MKKKLLHIIGIIFSLSLLIAALLVIHYELKEYDIHDIFYRLKRLQSLSLFLAVMLTVLSYSLMTVYDTLALRYIHHPLKYGRTAIASFISYSISNNMGLLILSGAPVRYRLYSAWGLTAVEIANVVVFCSLSLWAGFFTLGGSVFLIEPLIIPSTVSSRFTSVRAIGIIFLLLSAGYIMLSVFRKRPLKIGKWEFPLIPPKLSLSQITVSSLDWALVGGVLYVLLPPHPGLSYPEFLGIFMLAQFFGIVSNVPGGLGVFESVVIILLSPVMEPSTILGSLLAFRGIYYILPLIVSSVLLGTFEIIQRKEGVKRTFHMFSRLITVLTPHVLTFTTFMGGIILLVSGATPALGSRLAWLRDFVPLPVVEISHFLGSLAGAGLIMLAQGLQRRLDAAYILTLILLGMGALFSLLKGLDYEEASILLVMFCALLASRRHFYRKASLIGQRFTPGWTAAISAVLICTAWLGIFSYKHIEYSNNLWWQFTFAGDAPRFLRATVGAVVVILVISTAKLLRPVTPEFSLPVSSDLEKIHSITAESRDTSANLAFLGDKRLLFSESGKAFIMYGVEGRSWVTMGDPVGPREETAELAWRFREMCDHHNGWTVFYEVGTENLQVYSDLGLTFVKLGEEGRVLLETFSLKGHKHKDMRHVLNKLDREGCSFEIMPPETVSVILPELKTVSDAWLEEKKTGEKGFSPGFFNDEYLKRFPAAVVKREGKIIAFTNIWTVAGKEELSIDLMRYLPDAPHGTMDYLFIRLILWGKQEGYKWFNLGMAPLSGLEDHALAPLWSRLGAFVFRHGEHFYNCQGLRQYKEKFDPEWQPKYVAYPCGLSLPRILTNIASLISRGPAGILTK